MILQPRATFTRPHTTRGRATKRARVLARSPVDVIVFLLALLVGFSGCTAFTKGAPLSSRPVGGEAQTRRYFLSTGAAPRPYLTLGFVQVTGWGNQVAGVIDVGDSSFDATIHGAIVDAMIRMGGDGVINIEFLDENPQTPAERAGDLAETMQNFREGEASIKMRWRSVRATGEVIKFID